MGITWLPIISARRCCARASDVLTSEALQHGRSSDVRAGRSDVQLPCLPPEIILVQLLTSEPGVAVLKSSTSSSFAVPRQATSSFKATHQQLHWSARRIRLHLDSARKKK